MTRDEVMAFLQELRSDAITLSDETSSERVRRVFIGRAAMFAFCADVLANSVSRTPSLDAAIKNLLFHADHAAALDELCKDDDAAAVIRNDIATVRAAFGMEE